jgi:hypothetical protein
MNSSSDLYEADVCFSSLLLDSIDEVLGNLLGERAKQIIYGCLERQGLRKHQIPENLPGFNAFLEDNFGRGGAAIERQIAKRLYAQLGMQLVEATHYALTDYVDMASR